MITIIKSHGDFYITSDPRLKAFKSLPGKIKTKTKHLNIKRLARRKSGIIHFSINADNEIDINLTPEALML